MTIEKAAKIYLGTLTEAFMAVIGAWRYILIQIPVLFLLGIISPIFGVFGMAGGLILNLVLTLVVSYYLVLVRSVVHNEKFSLEVIKQEGLILFYPALSLFFALYVVQLTLSFVRIEFIQLAVGILICVLLNPIIEFLYLKESDLLDLVQQSFDFISRHFLVWFFPIFLLVSPLVLKQPASLVLIFSQDPLNMIRSTIGILGSIFSFPSLAISFIPLLYIAFFIMVFRGKLILKLL